MQNLPQRGVALIKWKNKSIFVRYADTRKYIDYCASVYRTFCPSRAVDIIEKHMTNTTKGVITTLGNLKTNGAWQKVKCHEQLALATENFARVTLGLINIFLVLSKICIHCL